MFKPAIVQSAAAIVVAHEHPSGIRDPSAEDSEFTRRLHQCGELLGIRLLDHLVVANGDFAPLKDRGDF